MTITDYRRLRIAIAALGLFVVSAVCADRVEAQVLTLNANVQLTKLHPSVSHVSFSCLTAPLTNGIQRGSTGDNRVPVVNRGYVGTLSTPMYFTLPAEIPANHTITVTCNMWLHVNNTGLKQAVASATQPETITAANWNIVAAGSTVTWTQAVTFPNLNAAP